MERIYRARKLKSSDIILINDSTNNPLGLEVKKLEANHKGKDPRGLTLDYNTTVPCGITSIRSKHTPLLLLCAFSGRENYHNSNMRRESSK